MFTLFIMFNFLEFNSGIFFVLVCAVVVMLTACPVINHCLQDDNCTHACEHKVHINFTCLKLLKLKSNNYTISSNHAAPPCNLSMLFKIVSPD